MDDEAKRNRPNQLWMGNKGKNACSTFMYRYLVDARWVFFELRSATDLCLVRPKWFSPKNVPLALSVFHSLALLWRSSSLSLYPLWVHTPIRSHQSFEFSFEWFAFAENFFAPLLEVYSCAVVCVYFEFCFDVWHW